MAKKRGRKFGRYLKGKVHEQIDLGALAALDLISQLFTQTVNERTRVSSIVASWALSDWTALVDDGPIMVGIAHGDYSDAEIEAFIENAQSWNEGDLVGQEVAKRKIRTIGIFRTEDATASAPAAVATLNEGRPIKTKLNWVLNQQQTLRFWAYNLGTSVLTAGAHVNCEGHANLWPL